MRSSLSVDYEQADARREGRTHLARPDSQARTGTTRRFGNHSRLIHTLLKVLTIHTYYLQVFHPHLYLYRYGASLTIVRRDKVGTDPTAVEGVCGRRHGEREKSRE